MVAVGTHRFRATLMRQSAICLVFGLTVATCALITPSGSPASVEETPSTTSRASVADVATCPVTLPVGVAADGQDRPFASSALAFGNSQLWVVPLQEDGVIRAGPSAVESDGSISTKFGWWRITPGTLTISGRRLDAPAPAVRASVPDGYGSSGFQASGVTFPTDGCWEITGSVGGGTLSFVTFVVRT